MTSGFKGASAPPAIATSTEPSRMCCAASAIAAAPDAQVAETVSAGPCAGKASESIPLMFASEQFAASEGRARPDGDLPSKPRSTSAARDGGWKKSPPALVSLPTAPREVPTKMPTRSGATGWVLSCAACHASVAAAWASCALRSSLRVRRVSGGFGARMPATFSPAGDNSSGSQWAGDSPWSTVCQSSLTLAPAPQNTPTPVITMGHSWCRRCSGGRFTRRVDR